MGNQYWMYSFLLQGQSGIIQNTGVQLATDPRRPSQSEMDETQKIHLVKKNQ